MNNHLNQTSVDIVLPNYNSEPYVSETIDSVINQTFKNWKLTIVDDNSNIATQKVLKNYANHQNINIISGSYTQQFSKHEDKTLFLTALIPSEAADLFELTPGDTIIATPTVKDSYESVVVQISGIFERKPSGENIWYLEILKIRN